MDALADDAATVVQAEYTGNGIGSVVEGWAEGRSCWRHVFGFQGSKVGSYSLEPDVVCVANGDPFGFSLASSIFKRFLFTGKRFGVKTLVASSVEARRKSDTLEAGIRHITVH